MYQTFINHSGETVIIGDFGDKIISFVAGDENTDYAAYLAWVEEGNEPEVIDNTAPAE